MRQTTNSAYQGYMVQFMSFLHFTQYDSESTFTMELLAEIAPPDIARWMCLKCFGMEAPGPEDRPKHLRGSTLEVYKKALSWYMPNRIATWDAIHQSGNPTKSDEVNDLIKFVKQMEVRKQGKPPCTKRALTHEEFTAILLFFRQKNDFQYQHRYHSMILYQYYLIARCDDVAHFSIRDLHGHTDVRFAQFTLQSKVAWSKNVYEERDCPDQIFFGSFDTNYCLFISLSLYLEIWLGDHKANNNKYFLFGDDNEHDNRAVERIKTNYSATLRKYFVDFVRLSRELGTHSIRKYAASWARALGCLSDEIDGRGRWRKGSRRIVDRYINLEQQYLDAKVAVTLCVGGAIKYCLVEGCGVTKPWLEENVVPGIAEYFGGDSIVFVLALPLLWICLNDNLAAERVPLTLSTRIKEAYERIRVLDVGVNPVKRVMLEVNRDQDKLSIDEISELDENGELVGSTTPTNNNTRANGSQQNDRSNMILIKLQQLQHQAASNFDQQQQTTTNLRIEVLEKFKMVNKNMNKILIQPPRQRTPAQQAESDARNNFEQETEAARQPTLVAELSKAPKRLSDLWAEYAFGTGGRKAAKDFNSFERGAVKFSYCRRKVVWDCIAKFIHAGHSAPAAIEKILECYGKNQTVSNIIKSMVADKGRGGHPNLQF